MRAPIKITTPFPSLEEIAELVGASPSRVKRIVRLADEIVTSQTGRRNLGEARSQAAGKSNGTSIADGHQVYSVNLRMLL